MTLRFFYPALHTEVDVRFGRVIPQIDRLSVDSCLQASHRITLHIADITAKILEFNLPKIPGAATVSCT